MSERAASGKGMITRTLKTTRITCGVYVQNGTEMTVQQQPDIIMYGYQPLKAIMQAVHDTLGENGVIIKVERTVDTYGVPIDVFMTNAVRVEKKKKEKENAE